MALYHPLPRPTLDEICDRFGLHLESADGVPQGSINTNYQLQCREGRYFLRHTAVRKPDDLDFEAALLTHLRGSGFPCPDLVRAHSGEAYLSLENGLVSVFHFLSGEELAADQVTTHHAGEIGRTLGRLHRLGASFSGRRENPYGPKTLQAWLDDLRDRKLEPEVRAAIDRVEAGLATAAVPLGLPRGAIHADLFRDNVKWLDGRVSAVFDFEMACVDELALDLGITLLVWTYGPNAFDRPRVRALLEGYARERKLMPEERTGLYARTCFGAIRYTLSRVRDFHLAAASNEALQRKPWERYAQRFDALSLLGASGFAELCGW